MAVHTMRLPQSIEIELEGLVQKTGHTKSYFFLEALKSYLEDRADYIRAAAILEKVESGEIKTRSLDEMIARHDLEC